MRHTINIFVLFLIFLVSVNVVAQKINEELLQTMINNKSFRFVAEMVLPAQGNSRYLTSEYDLIVSDTLKAYLPYFGRAYSAPIGEEGGIKFESKEFDYTVKKKKKGWIVNLKPKDTPYSTELSLNITFSGTASLYVNDSRRQSINFNGYITTIK